MKTRDGDGDRPGSTRLNRAGRETDGGLDRQGGRVRQPAGGHPAFGGHHGLGGSGDRYGTVSELTLAGELRSYGQGGRIDPTSVIFLDPAARHFHDGKAAMKRNRIELAVVPVAVLVAAKAMFSGVSETSVFRYLGSWRSASSWLRCRGGRPSCNRRSARL